MKNYYTIVEKTNNKLHEGRFHIYTDGEEICPDDNIHVHIPNLIPLNQEELYYAKLNSNLVNILITREDTGRVVDSANITFDSAKSEWNEVYQQPIVIDTVQQHKDMRNNFIYLTQTKLKVPDLSNNAISVFNNYINELNALEINNNTVGTLTWPAKPF